MKIIYFFQSLKNACRGIACVFKSEQNFRIQIVAAVLVVGGIIYFPLRNWEVIVVILLITMVLTMELLNSALERFADLLKPRLYDYVSVIKDIMAGAVFITSIGALFVGVIIFLPHFMNILK